MSTSGAGAASIEAAFAAVHGAQAPERRAPALDGVLQTINAYRGKDHWHLVTLGFTELRAKAAGADPELSGWGHELTLITPPAAHPPEWAFALLLGTAHTIEVAGRPLHAGARLAPGPPLDGAGTGLTAIGVREDPFVTPVAFPFGRYTFLQLVGVTAGEFGVMRKVGTELVLSKLAERDPLLRTDPARATA